MTKSVSKLLAGALAVAVVVSGVSAPNASAAAVKKAKAPAFKTAKVTKTLKAKKYVIAVQAKKGAKVTLKTNLKANKVKFKSSAKKFIAVNKKGVLTVKKAKANKMVKVTVTPKKKGKKLTVYVYQVKNLASSVKVAATVSGSAATVAVKSVSVDKKSLKKQGAKKAKAKKAAKKAAKKFASYTINTTAAAVNKKGEVSLVSTAQATTVSGVVVTYKTFGMKKGKYKTITAKTAKFDLAPNFKPATNTVINLSKAATLSAYGVTVNVTAAALKAAASTSAASVDAVLAKLATAGSLTKTYKKSATINGIAMELSLVKGAATASYAGINATANITSVAATAVTSAAFTGKADKAYKIEFNTAKVNKQDVKGVKFVNVYTFKNGVLVTDDQGKLVAKNLDGKLVVGPEFKVEQ
ncbi:MAG: hypothetical protein VZR23_02715 [Lachnospiraceae bacterium]|nr:hypothetical protein [Lachnospiraceae bacterium]